MTARHQLRIGRRLGRDRAAIDATPAPPVGETLQLARERKGVDLYRAERDTRIRLRYLQSLEEGDWDELPAPVYTKGFLRNYALYLGLEPEEILERWRDEMEAMRTATRVAVAPPPMPLVEPGGRRLVVTKAMMVAALVGLVIVGFVGYIGFQLLSFVTNKPVVGLTYPPDRYFMISAETITLAGDAMPRGRINITAPGGQTYSTNADSAGKWEVPVTLTRGENTFTVVATDPATERPSDPFEIRIIVPLPSASPGATSTAAPPPPIAMTLLGPPNGTVTTDQTVTLSGRTTGTRITVLSTYLGAPGASPSPAVAPTPTPTPTLSPGASPAPTAVTTPVGPALDTTVTDGTFSEELVFPVGRWRVTVTSYATGLAPLTEEIELMVVPAPSSGLTLVLEIAGRPSWVRVVADGERVPGFGGGTLDDGATHTFTAQEEFCIRSGNAGSVNLTLNGVVLGPLGRGVGSWIVRPNAQPEPAADAC